jgi:peptidoglycan/LPS O-acetylase OafA/YrhL
MSDKLRFYEIDLFRFVAALSVVLFHYTFRGHAQGEKSILSFPELGTIFKYGYLGVDLFFMISGFVILLTALNRDVAGFTISRITRLYPTFWACVTLTALSTLVIGGERYSVHLGQYIANLTMVGELLGVRYVDGVYWSLLIELKFYFLVCLVLSLRCIEKIKFIAGGWAVATLLLSFVDAPNVVSFVLFPEWASYFIAGIMFCLIRLEGISLYKIIVVTVAYSLSAMYAYWRVPDFEKFLRTDFSEIAVIGIVSLFYLAFFMVSLGKTTLLNRKGMLIIGAVTYPLYLIHQNVGYMVFNKFGESTNKYILLLLTISLMILASYIIHRFVEQKISLPLRKLLNRAVSVFKHAASGDDSARRLLRHVGLGERLTLRGAQGREPGEPRRRHQNSVSGGSRLPLGPEQQEELTGTLKEPSKDDDGL